MKRFLVFLLAMLIAVAAFSQSVTAVQVSGSTAAVAWNAVTTLSDGSTIPTGDTIAYEVDVSPYTSGGSPSPTVLATVSTLTYTITFATEGVFTIGVRTKRTIAGSGGVIVYSNFIWSSVGGTPNPFYFVYYKSPNAPAGISHQ